jgi:two-component system, chemotaxis family, protein-glutamate methylesterase/glutaminase
MAEPIRVLIVDDSAFMRNALARRIGSDPRFEIAGTASNGQEGVDKVLALKPDVMTLDVEMPVLNGLDALKQIVARSATKVIMVSAVTETGAKITLDALAIGAFDFIPKSQRADLIHEKLFAAARAKAAPFAYRKVCNAAAPAIPSRQPLMSFRPKCVVIGSSTGGPQALQHIMGQLTNRMPFPVFVAQHMPKPFTGAMARRLNDMCAPNVKEASDGEEPLRGTVYIAPGGLHMRICDGLIRIAADENESFYRPSVDILAASVLKTYGKHVLAIMLTGLGNDGTREFANLRAAGAMTIAQDEASCAVFGMPRSLIEANAAIEVLPLDRIGFRINEIAAAAI